MSPTKNRDDLPQPSWKKSAFWKWGHTNKMIHSSLVSGDELTDVPTVDHRFWGIGRPWARQKYPEWGYWPVILRSDHLPGSSVKPPLRRKLWIKIGKVNGDHYRIAPDGKWSSLTEKVAEAKNNQIGSKSRLGMSIKDITTQITNHGYQGTWANAIGMSTTSVQTCDLADDSGTRNQGSQLPLCWTKLLLCTSPKVRP